MLIYNFHGYLYAKNQIHHSVIFFNCFFNWPWLTLGHSRGGGLTNLTLITASETNSTQ